MMLHKYFVITRSYLSKDDWLLIPSHFSFSLSVVAAVSDGKKYELKEDGISVDVKLPIKHLLSRELQVTSVVLGAFQVLSTY